MSRRPAALSLNRSMRVDASGPQRVSSWAISIALLGCATYVVLFVVAVMDADDELLHALTIAPLLLLLTVPIALRIARQEGDPKLASIVMAGVVAKLLMAGVRFYVAYVVYSGSTDAQQYHNVGEFLAPDFRRFVFTADIGTVVGTGFTKILTGAVYAVFGVGRIGGFLVFAWLGFLGLLLFARAFRIAVPDGDGRRYLLLLLFLPSMLYWPSAIGKEAWMMLALGLCAYGIACVFQRRWNGGVALIPGLFLVVMIRPHLGLLVFVGVVFALLVRRAPARSFAVPLARIVGFGALLVIGVFLAGQTASFLGQESLTTQSVNVELSDASAQTGEGGSSFTPVRVTTPLHLVPAFVTIFFRPFPHEAGNAQGLLSAAEAMLLLGLCIAARKRLRSIPSMIRTTPYVGFCVGFVLTFVYAFSSFGNFGILARQRVQALPFLLALLVIPPFQRAVTSPARGRSRQLSPGTPRRRPPRRTGRPPALEGQPAPPLPPL